MIIIQIRIGDKMSVKVIEWLGRTNDVGYDNKYSIEHFVINVIDNDVDRIIAKIPLDVEHLKTTRVIDNVDYVISTDILRLTFDVRTTISVDKIDFTSFVCAGIDLDKIPSKVVFE